MIRLGKGANFGTSTKHQHGRIDSLLDICFLWVFPCGLWTRKSPQACDFLDMFVYSLYARRIGNAVCKR